MLLLPLLLLLALALALLPMTLLTPLLRGEWVASLPVPPCCHPKAARRRSTMPHHAPRSLALIPAQRLGPAIMLTQALILMLLAAHYVGGFVRDATLVTARDLSTT